MESLHVIAESLSETVGDNIEASTPIVATQAADANGQDTNTECFIPVHAKFEDSYIP